MLTMPLERTFKTKQMLLLTNQNEGRVDDFETSEMKMVAKYFLKSGHLLEHDNTPNA